MSETLKQITCSNDATVLMEKFSKFHDAFFSSNDVESATKVYDDWFTNDALIYLNENRFDGKTNILAAWGSAPTYVTKTKTTPTLRQWHKNGFSFSESHCMATADGQEFQWSFDANCVYDFKSERFSLFFVSSSDDYMNTFFAGLMAFLTPKK